MANEITVTATLNCTKSGNTSNGTATKQITLVGDHFANGIQDIGTGAELIVYPTDLLSEGVTYVYFKNLDDTNFVEIAVDNFTHIFTKLLPGQAAVFASYQANPTYYAKADTAGIQLSWVAVGT